MRIIINVIVILILVNTNERIDENKISNANEKHLQLQAKRNPAGAGLGGLAGAGKLI